MAPRRPNGPIFIVTEFEIVGIPSENGNCGNMKIHGLKIWIYVLWNIYRNLLSHTQINGIFGISSLLSVNM